VSLVQVISCEQGTPEWHAARAGIPTASCFATVLASGRTKGSPSVTRAKYMRRLIGERILGQVSDGYSNDHMERGHRVEPEARNFYALMHDVDPVQVGFLRRTDIEAGASPDSLIGQDGSLEIKTKLAELQIEILIADRVPPEHDCQLQGQLWVGCREWVDFVSYCPRLPLFVKRVYRDEKRIAEIAVGVREFLDELNECEARIRAMREAA
jgi:hypothetical protein